MIETIVKIDGMMCGMCESHICDHIRKNFNIKKVSASHSKGQAVILSEESISAELLKEKIGETGYAVLDVQSGSYQKKQLFGLWRHNDMNNKLTVPDLISIGVFTALYFALVTMATFSSAVIAPGFNNVILPALCAAISGSVYMLLVAKVQKFGAISVMGIAMGLFFMTSGHFIVSFAANIVMGIAADFVAGIGKYKSKKGLLASYILFSYGLFGPVLPLWFMKAAYIANLEARGKDAAYIANLFTNINLYSFVIAVAATLVCALAGGWFGQKMVKKHFVKAGIV